MMTVGNTSGTRPIMDTTLATSISAQSQTIAVSAEDTLGKQDNEVCCEIDKRPCLKMFFRPAMADTILSPPY